MHAGKSGESTPAATKGRRRLGHRLTLWSINVAKPPYRCWRSPPFSIRFASRASIRWLRDVDRPPRRSLSNELLIARGTPPNLGGEFSKPRTNGQSPVPSGNRRGGCATKKKDPFRNGADGVVIMVNVDVVTLSGALPPCDTNP